MLKRAGLIFLLLLAAGAAWAEPRRVVSTNLCADQLVLLLADREQIASLKDENAKLVSQAASYERQAQIEHAANLETAKQLKNLNEENVRIQEDLAFFQNLSLPGTHEGELSIQRFKVEHDTLPGEYRYRLLLVRSGQQRAKEFQGNLQLLVNVQQNGKKAVVVFPQGNKATEDAAYKLNFKYYQRIEHSFQLPPDMSVESIQVRVFEHGVSEPKIKQNVNTS